MRVFIVLGGLDYDGYDRPEDASVFLNEEDAIEVKEQMASRYDYVTIFEREVIDV